MKRQFIKYLDEAFDCDSNLYIERGYYIIEETIIEGPFTSKKKTELELRRRIKSDQALMPMSNEIKQLIRNQKP